MIREKRFANIVEYLKANHTATVLKLSELNDVSIDTVRRDLKILEDKDLVERVRGGAIWKDHTKTNKYMVAASGDEAKGVFASQINYLLEDGMTVVLNSGRTNIELAKDIVRQCTRLTVITNDLQIAKILSGKEHFRVILLGGIMDMQNNATYGNQCEKEVLMYNADILFLNVDSISLERGVSDDRINQIETFRKMMQIAQTIAITADEKAFETISCLPMCRIEDVDVVVSGTKLDKDHRKAYEMRGIKLLEPDS